MYRSMLYYLFSILAAAVIFSALGILPYDPFEIIIQAAYLAAVCYVANHVLAKIFRTSPNPESQTITALILALIIGPGPVAGNALFLTLAAVFAMASKYIVAYQKRHIFNPAAFAVLLTGLTIGQGASWWVGNVYLLIFVILGGAVMIRKIARYGTVGSFLGIYIVLALLSGVLPRDMLDILLHSPLLFFSFVMLVEPLTAPQDRRLRIFYAGAAAAVYGLLPVLAPAVTYGLELALLLANGIFKLIQFDRRLALTLVRKEQVGSNIYSFWWERPGRFAHAAGQFLEWTLPHPHADSRGIRRFFTIASSPTEDRLLLTTKFTDQNPSSFKRALKTLAPGQEIYVRALSGDFVLPAGHSQKLAFIAGGIGITPFRSMIKYLVDTKDCYDIILLYSVKREDEIVYREIFERYRQQCKAKIVFAITEKTGNIDEKFIRKEVPDWAARLFYLSGPELMVRAFEKMLSGMSIARGNIKRDFFPGYADTLFDS